jgi:succinoglycan biosynthesis protein ExoO
MPDVSVVITAWNAEPFVANAIKSALDQRGVSVEVVVVDNASTDGTAVAVSALRDPRIRCLRLEPPNRGPAGGRNAALQVVSGTWIAVLDADDVMLPDRLARLVAVGETNDLDIVADNLWMERKTTQGVTRQLLIDEALDRRLQLIDLKSYILGNLIFVTNLATGYLKPLFRANFLRRHDLWYDETLQVGEDFQLVAEALANGARYGRQSSAGYIYVRRPGSVSYRLSGAHIASMIAADRRFLDRFGDQLSVDEMTAARVRLRCLKEGAAFVGMVECIKSRHAVGLLQHLIGHPRAVRHFRIPIRAALSRLRGGREMQCLRVRPETS